MPIMPAPNMLTATEIARQIDGGTLTAEAVVRAHLDRIDARDKDVLAWTHLAREAALERARLLDRGPRKGLLHGVPMGVPDVLPQLSTGAIDSFFGSPLSTLALQWGTHAKYMTSMVISQATGATVIADEVPVFVTVIPAQLAAEPVWFASPG